MDDAVTVWPDLPYASWRETAATLQLWTQIVGTSTSLASCGLIQAGGSLTTRRIGIVVVALARAEFVTGNP